MSSVVKVGPAADPAPGISPEDVVLAYRMILGREPESEEIVRRYSREVGDIQALRQLFMASAEFREQFERVHAPVRPRRGYYGQVMSVEIETSPEDLEALYVKTAAQWNYLGETEPYWSVITNEKFLSDRFEKSRDVFYAGGKSEADILTATLQRHGIDLSQSGVCLELGCGVGRVTHALAAYFERVLAVDISGPHLDIARAQSDRVGLTNVDYVHLTHPTRLGDLPAVDCFYSKLVLQHNTPPVMAILLKQMFDLLKPGGVGLFQIPVYRVGYKFSVAQYLREHNDTEMEMHFFPQPALLQLIESSGCRLLEIHEDDAIGLSHSAVSNTVMVQKLSGT